MKWINVTHIPKTILVIKLILKNVKHRHTHNARFSTGFRFEEERMSMSWLYSQYTAGMLALKYM